MWVLRNLQNEDPPYYILCGKEHLVGRKDTDFILSKDQSISRKHAMLQVIFDEADVGRPGEVPRLVLTDTGSKYGTFINGNIDLSIKMSPNAPQPLQEGDRVRFGVQWNEWRVEREPIIVSTSTLPVPEKKELKSTLAKLGGHLVGDWQDKCTHLTMNSLTLTVKVVCALAAGKPIVTLEYWQKFLEAASSRNPLPKYEEFIPVLAESTLNKNEVLFVINEKRHELFSGKTFVFRTEKQYSRLACMITAAGGKAATLERSGMTKEDFCGPNVILMQHSTDKKSQSMQSPDSYEEIIKYLKQNGRRVIPEADIGLAVLFCSMEKHCNPEFDITGTVLLSKNMLSTQTQGESHQILAADSQASTKEKATDQSDLTPTCRIIPETGHCSKDMAGAQRKSYEETTDMSSMNTVPVKYDLKEELLSQDNIFMTRHTQKRTRDDSDNDDESDPLRKKVANETNTIQSEKWSCMPIKDEILDFPQPVKEEPQDNISINNEDADLFEFATVKTQSRKVSGVDPFSYADKPTSAAPEAVEDIDSVTGRKKRKPSSFTISLDEPPAKKVNVRERSLAQNESNKTNEPEKEATQGFMSKDNENKEVEKKVNPDEHLTREFEALEVIEKDLLRPQRVIPGNRKETNAEDSTAVNFKKFRKSRPYSHGILPHIIGGRDLFQHEDRRIEIERHVQNSKREEEVIEEEALDDEWRFDIPDRSKRR